MSKLILINSLEFAHRHERLAGSIAIVSFERLADQLTSNQGNVSYELVGGGDAMSRPTLHLRVNAELSLQCQRCLMPVVHTLAADTRLTVFTNELKLEAACMDDESLDAVLAESEYDVLALIEDEVLLGLPLAPCHTRCDPEALLSVRGDEKPNPFAVLASLKKSSD